MAAFNCWMNNHFRNLKERKAVIYDSRTYTYEDLANQIERYQKQLKKLAIGENTVVAIHSDYSFNAIALFYALVENRNIIVPIISNNKEEIEQRIQSAEVDYFIEFSGDDLEVKTIDSKKDKHPLIKQITDRGKAGLILFSSGSTGEPKAIIHDLDNLINSYQNRKIKDLNTLIFLTFDHIGGIDTMMRIFSIGGTLTIPSTRQAEEICRLIEQHEVNVLPSSPTFLNLMLISGLHKKYDLGSLKIIAFGAEPMPESLLLKLKDIFPGVELQQKFGTSETNAVKVTSRSDSLLMKLDDPNIEYKIVDNELWLKSKTQALGYLNAPMDSFTEDGWFKTGDLVETTEDGYIKIIGRNKEVINVGGEKVLPAEVEAVLLAHEAIDDAMVYGEENPITGQSVAVDLVMKEEMDKRDVKKLVRKHCKEKLDNYKIPTKINIVDQTNYGERFKKIRRRK